MMTLLLRLATAMALFALLVLQACTSTHPPPAEVITVEGRVTVRGNAPFSAMVLETAEHNLYVLVAEEDEDAQLRSSTPARLRVTGVLYVDDWGGRPFAHLRVQRWERM